MTPMTQMTQPHCDTCECSDSGSLSAFNVRIGKLIESGNADLMRDLAIRAPWLRDRLSDSPRFAFGFNRFLLAQMSMRICGFFLASVHPFMPRPEPEEEGYYNTVTTPWADIVGGKDDGRSTITVRQWVARDTALNRWRRDTRFFGVAVEMPTTPRPFEYHTGDAFFIGNDPLTVESIEWLSAWSDEQLSAWLESYRSALVAYVVDRCAM